MIALITGGAGFIGSHLAEYLIKKNQQVIILDDLSTGSLNNLAKISNSSSFHFYKGSILDGSILERLINSTDVIYHLAACVGVQLVIKDPLNTIKNNIWGTENVLKIASQKRKKVLLASTSEVYGKSAKMKFSEEDDLILGPTIKSRWSYASSKIIDEHLTLAYLRQKKLPVIITRLFNTVGERQTGRYGMVLPRLIQQAIKNEDMTIYGNGTQSRCFCYVKDVVWALKRLMEHPKSIGQIYNIGSTESITINKLADKIVHITGSKSKKTYIPYAEIYGEGFEETHRRMPDIKKLQKLIGFNPKHDLNSVILKIKDYTSCI